MTEMTMKEALEFTLSLLKRESIENEWPHHQDKCKMVYSMLRDGGPVVEKSDEDAVQKCGECGSLSWWDVDVCKKCGCVVAKHYYKVKAVERWSEREKLKVFVEKSETTFEEVK